MASVIKGGQGAVRSVVAVIVLILFDALLRMLMVAEMKRRRGERSREDEVGELKNHKQDPSNNNIARVGKSKLRDLKNERPLLPLIQTAETISGNNHAGVHSAKRQGQADVLLSGAAQASATCLW